MPNIPKVDPGFRLVDGSILNQLIDAYNAGASGAVAATTLTSSGNSQIGGAGSTVGFFGNAGVVRPVGAAQTAITDSSGGTANPATGVAANGYKNTFMIPAQLLDFANAQVWKLAIPYAFTVTAAGFRTGRPATTAAKLATLTTQINGVACTGGVISITSANQATTGVLTAGTAITALNVGTAGQTLEIAVSAVTTFIEGDGWVEFTVVNNDQSNGDATIIALLNAIRSALVSENLIKGAA